MIPVVKANNVFPTVGLTGYACDVQVSEDAEGNAASV